jgi:hypothetical protein
MAWAVSRAQALRKEEQQLQPLKDGYWLIQCVSKHHGLSKQLAAAVIVHLRATARAAVVVQQNGAMSAASEGAAAGLVIPNYFSARTFLFITQVCEEAQGHPGVQAAKDPTKAAAGRVGGFRKRARSFVGVLGLVGRAAARGLGHLLNFLSDRVVEGKSDL